MFDPIEIICFDLDDTLWPCKPVLERAEQLAYEWMAIHCPAVVARYSSVELINRRIEYMSGQSHLRHDMSSMRYNFFVDLFE